MDKITLLKMLKNTLNMIKVSGEEDLDRMLASIRTVDSIIESLGSENNTTGKSDEVH